MSLSKSSEKLKTLLEDPDTWANVLKTAEARWVAAMLARFVTIQDDGGVLFPTLIQVNGEVTGIHMRGIMFTRAQMLAGLDSLAEEKMLTFSRGDAQVTLLTGYRDMVTSFIQ